MVLWYHAEQLSYIRTVWKGPISEESLWRADLGNDTQVSLKEHLMREEVGKCCVSYALSLIRR